MARTEVVGALRSTRHGYRAVVAVDGLDGWEITVESERGPLGDRIVALSLRATNDELVLTGEALRQLSPTAILAAMSDPFTQEWALSTDSEGAESTAGLSPQLLPGRTRTRLTHEYLVALTTVALDVQGKSRSMYGELARLFDRTVSQIRNDLHRARTLGYLLPSEPGSRRVQAGPNLPTPTKRVPRKGTSK